MEKRLNFSQRMGHAPIKKPIQIGSIDTDLRNTLWNLLSIHYWNKFDLPIKDPLGRRIDLITESNLANLFEKLWLSHFKEPIDDIPILFFTDSRVPNHLMMVSNNPNGLGLLKDRFFNTEWNKAFDFVEFVCQNGPKEYQLDFVTQCNMYLEKENAGYRFVDENIIEISSTVEVSEIETAIEKSTPYYGVKQHLKTAVTLLSDRQSPDYRNSIKESISAVEALCKKVTGEEKATLIRAIKSLEKDGSIHSSLKKAFSSLYEYTSDSDGIRHALMEESYLTGADARFMLISCSAFINYVITRIN